MKEFCNQHFVGERALFKLEDAKIEKCLFDDGESPLKEGKNLTVSDSTFGYKYPLWYGKNHKVSSCEFLPLERAGVWYTDDSSFKDCQIDGPKNFRKCSNLELENIVFTNALETLWWNKSIKLKNVKASGGDYFGLGTENAEIDGLELNGNYAFDGSKKLVINNSKLNTKDAFWNCEDILIENCEISGEYFGWNSKNITIRNSRISSHQGFCYIENLRLENVEIYDTDLAFEYCKNIEADIKGHFQSIKNPITGHIKAEHFDKYIQDDETIDFSKVIVEKSK